MIGNLPKLPACWALIAVPLLLSRLMSGIISFVKMLRTLGWFDGFIALRLHNGMIVADNRLFSCGHAAAVCAQDCRPAGGYRPAEAGAALLFAQLSGLSSRGSPPFTALQRDFDYRPDNP